MVTKQCFHKPWQSLLRAFNDLAAASFGVDYCFRFLQIGYFWEGDNAVTKGYGPCTLGHVINAVWRERLRKTLFQNFSWQVLTSVYSTPTEWGCSWRHLTHPNRHLALLILPPSLSHLPVFMLSHPCSCNCQTLGLMICWLPYSWGNVFKIYKSSCSSAIV